MPEQTRIVDFLFEALMLKRTPRSGYAFLGNGRESVAEHSFGATVVAFALAQMNQEANLAKVIKLALFHDLAEARTGDLNYMNKRYVKADENAALKDCLSGLVFGPDIAALHEEWRQGETLEARLAADADQLDMMLELRRLGDLGNPQADDWLFYADQRLKTSEGRALASKIVSADHSRWWFEKKREYWVLNDNDNKKA